jgi:hypothetical protein
MDTIIAACIASVATLVAAFIIRPRPTSGDRGSEAKVIHPPRPGRLERFREWSREHRESALVTLSYVVFLAIGYDFHKVSENFLRLSADAETAGLADTAIAAAAWSSVFVVLQAVLALGFGVALIIWVRRSVEE